jgi:hypothetical protein
MSITANIVNEWAKNVIFPAPDRVYRGPAERLTAATSFARCRHLERQRCGSPGRV